MLLAFKDKNDGYYQFESPDGEIPEWAEGMTPCDVQRSDISPIVPTSVTRFQARAALMQTPSTNGYDNMLEEAEAIIARDDTDPMARMAWNDAAEFWRDSPLIALVVPESEIDDFMRTAAAIEPWMYSRG